MLAPSPLDCLWPAELPGYSQLFHLKSSHKANVKAVVLRASSWTLASCLQDLPCYLSHPRLVPKLQTLSGEENTSLNAACVLRLAETAGREGSPASTGG